MLLVPAFVIIAGAKEHFFRNISEMGDFGGLTINTIYQDSTGYVWMGSDRGVLRCDGIHTRLIPFDTGGGSRPCISRRCHQCPAGSWP